jgi:sugar phosphate permease
LHRTDAVARFYLAGVLELTEDSWAAVFWVSAITLGVIGVLCFFLLKGSPADVGLPPEEEEGPNGTTDSKPSLSDSDEGDGGIQVRHTAPGCRLGNSCTGRPEDSSLM